MSIHPAVKLAAFGALDFESLGLSTLDKAVAALRVDTRWGPPIYIPSPFAKSSQEAAETGKPPTVIPGKGFDLGRSLRPKVTLVMRSGWGKNLSFAPYGNPGTSLWGIVALAGVATVLLAVVGGVRLARGR